MYVIRGVLSLAGRVCLVAIFVMSAVGNKIVNFSSVADGMAAEGILAPKVMLVGATAFLLLGSLSLVLGYRPRLGATLLLVFLAGASYFYHDFWTVEDAGARQAELVQFMKNVALIGAMLLVVANGTGPWSMHPAGEKPATDSEVPQD